MFKTTIAAIALSIVSSSAFALTLECTGEVDITIYEQDYAGHSFAWLRNEDIKKKATKQDKLIVNITDDKISIDGAINFTVYAKGQGNTTIGSPYYTMEVYDTEILAYFKRAGWDSERNEYTDDHSSGDFAKKAWLNINRLTGNFVSDSTYIYNNEKTGKAVLLENEMSGVCKLAKPLF